jgi:hypothetical protein
MKIKILCGYLFVAGSILIPIKRDAIKNAPKGLRHYVKHFDSAPIEWDIIAIVVKTFYESSNSTSFKLDAIAPTTEPFWNLNLNRL